LAAPLLPSFVRVQPIKGLKGVWKKGTLTRGPQSRTLKHGVKNND